MAKVKVEDLPKCLLQKLVPIQKWAILKCLKRHGRIILNDELGLGKRLVAISTAIVYKPEWPLLIVCPFVLRDVWREEFVKWIPNLDTSKIQIISPTIDINTQLPLTKAGASIFIVAY